MARRGTPGRVRDQFDTLQSDPVVCGCSGRLESRPHWIGRVRTFVDVALGVVQIDGEPAVWFSMPMFIPTAKLRQTVSWKRRGPYQGLRGALRRCDKPIPNMQHAATGLVGVALLEPEQVIEPDAVFEHVVQVFSVDG